ncbi:UTRA domain-containing protein [Altererythrobacter aquiaggeris]|uniref:UTRA domain-containing protein n=1 Tax=Aestuarierythrobacter aquiaggeris TaxID=1898396 RepID=UPI003019ECB8
MPTGRGSLPGHLAEQIYGDVTGEWHCFRGVRRHADHLLPIAVTDAYFHEMLGDAVGMLDLSGGTLFNQIERLSGVAIGRVTQCTQAIAATKEVAALLEMDTASPVLRIMRVYTNPAGQIFEISASHHPGGRFAYMMHIDVDS